MHFFFFGRGGGVIEGFVNSVLVLENNLQAFISPKIWFRGLLKVREFSWKYGSVFVVSGGPIRHIIRPLEFKIN